MKHIKSNTCSFLILLLLLIGVESLWAQVKEKRVDKTFNVNGNTRLSIYNKFGKVHINTWDQKNIKAEVVVEADGSESAAREILERINIDVSESSSDIRIETEISESNNQWKNQRFSIDYTISMPRTNPLNIEHRHGDLYIDNFNGVLKVDLAHGQIVAEELNGKSEINLQHGNGGRIAAIGSGSLEIQHYQSLRLGKIGNVEVEIAHASADIEQAGNLNMELRHSNLEFENVGDLSLDMQHSKLEAESIKSLRVEMQHSSIDSEKLGGPLYADCNHSQLKVGRLSPNFSEVEFDGNHSYLGFDLSAGTSASLEVELNHGRLQYPESKVNMSHINIENNSREYQGRIGNGSGGRIEVDGNFTDVSIGID
jgi:hypothetical protein